MPRDLTSETLVHSGGELLKSIEVKDGIARVGSYGIRFSDSNSKDLTGEYFTANTDYGPRNGDGAVTMFNHGFLSADGLDDDQQKALDAATGRTYPPVKAAKDDVGIFIETVLNLADEYEKAIFELVQAGKLKWSSGTAAHLMRKSDEGEILRWHPIEFSYTPRPAEPRLPAIAPLKSVALDSETATEFAKAFAPKPPVVDKAAPPDSRPPISVITPPIMTPEEIAAQKAQIEKDANDRAESRIKDAQEIYSIGNAFGCAEKADQFVKAGKSLADFQAEVLNGMKVRPVTPDMGLVGMSGKEQRKYSLIKACYQMATRGRLEGLEKEAHEAAVKTVGRDVDTKGFMIPEDVVRAWNRIPLTGSNFKTPVNVTTSTQGGFLVDTDFGPMIELLRNKPQVVAAGCTTLGGLVGDLALPVQAGASSAYWVAETGALTDSAQTFSQKKMTPKRLGCTIPYTTQFLAQSSIDAESFIRDDATLVLSIEKDRAALLGAGVNGEPVGIANTTGINADVTYSTAATWAKVVLSETGIGNDNADIGPMAWILDSATVGKWKTILRDSVAGAAYLIQDGGLVNGYPYYKSNQINSAHQSFFGVWSQLVMASWAGLEVIVDPYALKKSGQVEITFNELVDMLVRQPLSFNVSTDSAAQ
jgi:HK97 family phage major capsid protein